MKRSTLVKNLDQWFSKYVRLSNSNEGLVNCYTCGIQRKWNDRIDAGHFQTRSKYYTRWDEMNVKPQCKGCNMTNGGQQYLFGQMLDQEYGEGTAESILIKSNQIRKFSNAELLEMIDHYKKEVKQLLEDIG